MLRTRLARLALVVGVVLVAGSALAAARRAAPGAAPVRAARSAPAGGSRNLLVNPGFEDPLPDHPWMPAGWDTTISGLRSVFFGRDTVLARGRGFSVSIANVSIATPMNHSWVQSLLVPPAWWNKDVVYSIWSRSNGVTGRAFIRMVAYRDTINKMARIWKVTHTDAQNRLHLQGTNDPQHELGWRAQNFSDEETGWVRRELRLHIAPSTNFLQVSAGIFGTGQVLFDDASLTLEPRAPDPPIPLHTNLLADPGFEESGDAWEISPAPYEGFRIERDSVDVHGGRYSVRYEGGEAAMFKLNTGVCQSFTNRRLAGMHLKFSGWVKTDSLMGEAFLMVYFKTVRGPEHTLPERIWGTTAWRQTSIEVDAPPDTYEVWAWAVLNGPSAGRVWFDDLRLEATGPAGRPGRAASSRRSRS